jgi:hypothetical protein
LDISDSDIKKALVTLALEKGLLDMGTPVLDAVAKRLYKTYKCYLPDCCDHPEYLNKTLKDLYGDSYKTIVESIRKHMVEFSYQKPIEEFLKAISG